MWLETEAFLTVYGIASFFAARVNERPTDVFSLNMVMGPDKDVPVNNSAYTEVTASIGLNFAAELGLTEGTSTPVSHSRPRSSEQALTTLVLHGYHPGYTKLKVKQDMFTIGWLNVDTFDKSARKFARSYSDMQWPFGVTSGMRRRPLRNGNGALHTTLSPVPANASHYKPWRRLLGSGGRGDDRHIDPCSSAPTYGQPRRLSSPEVTSQTIRALVHVRCAVRRFPHS